MGYFIEGPSVPATEKIRKYLSTRRWGYHNTGRKVVSQIHQPKDAFPHIGGMIVLTYLKYRERSQIKKAKKG